jgi:MoaA/NifB/PqqE/SkfB family radical SAM enzyme
MDWNRFVDIINLLYRYEARATTLTGGGEPLLYHSIHRAVRRLRDRNIEVGLVTNGVKFHRYLETPNFFKDLSWIRVSMDQHRDSIPSTDPVSVAYSYVYEKGSERDGKLWVLVKKARTGEIEHLRVVSDILDEGLTIHETVSSLDHPRIIVQDRTKFSTGAKQCWISLVKPVVDVDGQVYPCCGVQYAIDSPHQYPQEMSMGSVEEYLKNHVEMQVPFDGSRCKKCYYGDYNKLLESLRCLRSLNHVWFL